MKKLLDNIQNDIYKAFAWRLYNTTKSVLLTLLAIALPVLLIKLQETGDFSVLTDAEARVGLLYAIVVAVLIGAVAGLDKIRRV